MDEDWEEWNGKDPFWLHCVAGSIAGVAEHSLVYPLDTVRTHIQVCAECLHPLRNTKFKQRPQQPHQQQQLPTGMLQTIRHLMSEPAISSSASAASEVQGAARLWRGVGTMLVGCVPAHALYFSTYEAVKHIGTDEKGRISNFTASCAGAAATVGHDLVLTPWDTLKQRLQLGHYEGVSHAFTQILKAEGPSALWKSFPVTLATNIPYGVVLVTTNEYAKQELFSDGSFTSILASSSLAGLAAAAVTCPLDRVKTALQTQQLGPVCPRQLLCAQQKRGYEGWIDAVRGIYQTEGPRGLVRGMLPRILQHVPAAAISWTTYETAKKYLRSSSP